MPSEGHSLHPFTVVSGALRLARQLILPAVVGGATAADGIFSTIQWVVAILAVPSLVIAFAQWRAFRYRVEGHDLILHSGVLNRRRRVIPLVRIQNIDLEQGPLERLAGVAELRMETASGGGETEASLRVLAARQARTLQTELLRRRAQARAAARAEGEIAGRRPSPAQPAGPLPAEGQPSDPAAASAVREPDERGPFEGEPFEGEPFEGEPEPERRELLRLSTGDLAVAGATSNEAGLIAAGLATLLELADDLVRVEVLDQWLEGAWETGLGLGILGGVLLAAGAALGFVVLGWILSIFVSVIRYHGFTLTRSGDELKRSYGLFSRRHSTVPLERVQAVRIEETLLRRPFGLVALKIETAGSGPRQQQGTSGGAEAFVPIARRGQVGRLLREVFEDAQFEGVRMNAVSPLGRRRTFFRLAGPILLGTGIAAFFWEADALALLLLLAPAWLYARAEYRARAWARPPRYAILRGGVFTRVSTVVPERKVQTLHLFATPFQRRLGLETLFVDTAAGGRVPRVADIERPTARQVLAGIARDAERARRAALRARVGT